MSGREIEAAVLTEAALKLKKLPEQLGFSRPERKIV